MANKTDFDTKVKITGAIVKIVNEHWARLDGLVHNDKQFWDDTLHSLTNQDWEDMMSVMDALKAIEPELFSYAASTSFEEVKRVLIKEGHSQNARALDRPKHKKLEFKALMNVKDIINEISGYKKPSPPQQIRPIDILFHKGD